MFDSIPDNLPIADNGKEEQNNNPPISQVERPTVNSAPVAPPKNEPDIFDYVPLDEETGSNFKWRKLILIIVSVCLLVFIGFVTWLGKIPFTQKIIFNPPWQLTSEKVAQYVISDLLAAEHVKISAILTADRFKVILDDQVPQINNIKAEIKGDINFNTPYDSELIFAIDHDANEKTNLNYQIINGQAYLSGQSNFPILQTMFETSGSAKIVLPQQTSQPSLTFAEIKDIYNQNKFLIATGLERSTIDGQEYALVTLTTDPNIYQAFVQVIRDKKGVGLPYATNLDMIFSPQTTVKAAVRLSDKTFRNAFIEGVHGRLGKYKLSLTVDELDNKTLIMSMPESVITTKASLEVPQLVEIPGDVISEELKNLINQQSEVIIKLIGVKPQLPSDFSTGYNVDSDEDGILDVIEVLIGTLPNKSDSDDDGYGDLQEIEAGYNPLGEGKLEFPTSQTDINEVTN